MDPFLRRKPFSSVTPLVSYQLLSSGDNKKLENTSTDKISLKECFLDWGIGIYETRTLTFLRQSHIHQGKELIMFVFYACYIYTYIYVILNPYRYLSSHFE